jgi:hypothetical protein
VAVNVGESEVTPLPPLTTEPPLVALYQSIVQPPGAVALKVTVPEPQRELALGLVGAAGSSFIVTDTDAVSLSQPAAEVVTA